MKFAYILMTVFGLTLWVAANGASPQRSYSADRPRKTILAGVYTKAESERGHKTYMQACARCHG